MNLAYLKFTTSFTEKKNTHVSWSVENKWEPAPRVVLYSSGVIPTRPGTHLHDHHDIKKICLPNTRTKNDNPITRNR